MGRFNCATAARVTQGSTRNDANTPSPSHPSRCRRTRATTAARSPIATAIATGSPAIRCSQ
ncbi:MAG: hypothetical protein QM820_37295 [Minicystis sp.]